MASEERLIPLRQTELMPQPYKVFIVYAREDALYLSELLGQLRPLEIAGRIQVWSDREINPGVEWEKALVQQLDTAAIGTTGTMPGSTSSKG